MAAISSSNLMQPRSNEPAVTTDVLPGTVEPAVATDVLPGTESMLLFTVRCMCYLPDLLNFITIYKNSNNA